jgi:hypothetical protein
MGHQELYNPRGRIERIFLRSLLVLAVLGQVCGAPFTFKGQLRNAIVSCLTSVSGGEECCSSGLADCGPAGTTDMPDWDVGLIQDMSDLFNNFPQPPWRIFNQDISSWDVNNVTNMNFMFQYCKSFDADITGWETPKLLASAQMFGRLGTQICLTPMCGSLNMSESMGGQLKMDLQVPGEGGTNHHFLHLLRILKAHLLQLGRCLHPLPLLEAFQRCPPLLLLRMTRQRLLLAWGQLFSSPSSCSW